MVMYEAGMLARSKAGHDKAKMYIIKEVDDTYVYLVDGRIRTLVHPKKKKKKHVQIVHGTDEVLDDERTSFKSIRNFIERFSFGNTGRKAWCQEAGYDVRTSGRSTWR